MPSVQVSDEPTHPPLFLRLFNIGPRDRVLVLQVAQQEGAEISRSDGAVGFGAPNIEESKPIATEAVTFDGPRLSKWPIQNRST